MPQAEAKYNTSAHFEGTEVNFGLSITKIGVGGVKGMLD
jgi:hypothetical protein